MIVLPRVTFQDLRRWFWDNNLEIYQWIPINNIFWTLSLQFPVYLSTKREQIHVFFILFMHDKVLSQYYLRIRKKHVEMSLINISGYGKIWTVMVGHSISGLSRLSISRTPRSLEVLSWSLELRVIESHLYFQYSEESGSIWITIPLLDSEIA